MSLNDILCDRCHKESLAKSNEKSTKLQWTNTPPTDKDVGRWFVYRHHPRISELLFSHNVDRKLVLESVELWKFVEQGYEFFALPD